MRPHRRQVVLDDTHVGLSHSAFCLIPHRGSDWRCHDALHLLQNQQFCLLVPSKLGRWRDLPGLLSAAEFGLMRRPDRVINAALHCSCSQRAAVRRGWLTRKGGTLLRSTCWLTWEKASSKIPVHIIHTASLSALISVLNKSLSAL